VTYCVSYIIIFGTGKPRKLPRNPSGPPAECVVEFTRPDRVPESSTSSRGGGVAHDHDQGTFRRRDHRSAHRRAYRNGHHFVNITSYLRR
jgi:hypothetical protein